VSLPVRLSFSIYSAHHDGQSFSLSAVSENRGGTSVISFSMRSVMIAYTMYLKANDTGEWERYFKGHRQRYPRVDK